MSEEIHTVGELRALLSGFPDDAPLLCQAIGSGPGAVTMFLRGARGEGCGLIWNPQPVILTMRHPDIRIVTQEEG